jgi:predicted dehydrogenase
MRPSVPPFFDRDTDMTASSPLRLGILGCANIAKQFARDVAGLHAVRIEAVASRQLDKAQAFAAQFGIARALGSYEALLADPQIEAIYIPLPNHLHAQWAIRAAEAGKHVLCEKPLTLTLADARAMFDAARRHGVMLLEAYPYYFQPQTGDMLDLLHKGAIGEVRSVQASFGFTLAQGTGNIRWQPDMGGGALLDAGAYPISLIRLVMGQTPVRVLADANWSDTGVDISMAALLRYADGRQATMSCAMDAANYRRATIVGSQGTLETEYLNHTAPAAHGHPHGYLPSQLRVRRGIANTVPFEDVVSATGSGFYFAAQAFARVVRAGDLAAIERAARASLGIAATLQALQASARSGAWVEVERPTFS